MGELLEELLKSVEKGKRAKINVEIKGKKGNITIEGDMIGILIATKKIIQSVRKNIRRLGVDEEQTKEIFEFKNKEIKIKKYFLFFCYLKKTIKIKEIVKIKYISTGGIFSVILSILLAGIFFKDNIQIQANTGLDEDEAFYFGAIIGFEGYRKFCEIFRKVTNRDRANIYFLEEENESYNI